MNDTATAPVIAGLAAGIAFIIVIGSLPAPPSSLSYPTVNQSEDDRLANAAYNLPEVKAFRERFGQVGVTGYSSSDFGGMILCYTYPPIPCDHAENDKEITAYLEVRMDEKGQPINFTIYCNSGAGASGGTAAKIDVRAYLEEDVHCPK